MQGKGCSYTVLVDVLFDYNQKVITVTKPNKRKYRLMQNCENLDLNYYLGLLLKK